MKTVLITGPTGYRPGMVQFRLKTGGRVLAYARQLAASEALQELAGYDGDRLKLVSLDVSNENSIGLLSAVSDAGVP